VEAVIDPGTLTADEKEAIHDRRSPTTALHDCKHMAALLCELARTDREIQEVQSVFWLANRLCDRLDQLEDSTP